MAPAPTFDFLRRHAEQALSMSVGFDRPGCCKSDSKVKSLLRLGASLPDDEDAASKGGGLLGIDIESLFIFRGGGVNRNPTAACLIGRPEHWVRSESTCVTTRLSRSSRSVVGLCAGLTAATEEMATLTQH